jgi:hypothetical protein
MNPGGKRQKASQGKRAYKAKGKKKKWKIVFLRRFLFRKSADSRELDQLTAKKLLVAQPPFLSSLWQHSRLCLLPFAFCLVYTLPLCPMKRLQSESALQ